MEVYRGSCIWRWRVRFFLSVPPRGRRYQGRETSRRRRQQEDQSFPTRSGSFQRSILSECCNPVRCKSERTRVITLCFDLDPSVNQFMASKPKITNTTKTTTTVVNDKRQTYASLQFSFYFCDKYLILSSWFIGYKFLYLVLRFYFSYFLLVTPQPNNS